MSTQINADDHTYAALIALIKELGLGGATASEVLIEGSDPVVASRHYIGTAAAAAIAAQALAVTEIWQSKTGHRQHVTVAMRKAVSAGLRTVFNVFQNGRRLNVFPPSKYERADFFESKDGRHLYIPRTELWVENLLKTLHLLGCTYDVTSMREAVAKWDASDLEDAIAERKLVGVIARTRDEWLRHAQGTWLNERPVIEIEKIGDSSPVPWSPSDRPLSDVRVLDVANVIAGQTIGRILAEQGADILHLAAPERRDPFTIAIDTGFGKRSANIDLNLTNDRERLRDLVRKSDVFLQSWRPGSLDKFSCSPEELAHVRPGLIYVSVSAYGSGGPWSARGGYDPVGEVASGLAVSEGGLPSPKLSPVTTISGYLTAYLGAAGALSALIRRTREGGSYHVKVSLTRTAMWMHEMGVMLPVDSSGNSGFATEPTDFSELSSAFGLLRVPAPVAEYSLTKAYWNAPPPVGGSSIAEW